MMLLQLIIPTDYLSWVANELECIVAGQHSSNVGERHDRIEML